MISLLAIVTSLTSGALVLYWRGATFNIMLLAGLAVALGPIIDDAVSDVENIARRIRQARRERTAKSAARVVLEAAIEMRSAILFALLITLLAALPIFFIGGVSGSFFQPLAISYLLAVSISTLVALTLTPALSLLLLANQPFEQRSLPLAARLAAGYEHLLTRILHHQRAVFFVTALIIVIGMAISPFFAQDLLPTFEERQLRVQLQGAPGTSQREMSRITGLLSRELMGLPGVRNVGALVGRAIRGDQVVNVNSSELWVSIDPAANYAQTVAAIQQVVEGYPGFKTDVRTYLGERSRGLVAPPAEAIVVRIFGHDLDVLSVKAAELQDTLTRVSGVTAAHVQLPVQEPTIEIEVDLAKAQQFGIKPGDVRRAAATLLSGLQVGNVFEEQKVFDVVVWSTPETRSSVNSVSDLLIDTPSGGHVRIGDVAAVRIASIPTVIQRDAVSRYLDVRLNVSGRDLSAVASDVQSRLQQVKFPLEYHAEVLADFQERQGAQTRLLAAAVAAAIGIFFLLQAAFQSWRLAALSFLTLPSALVGGVAAVIVMGGVLSLGALVGFLTVFGIAARSSMALIKHYQRLVRRDGESFGPQLILRGARERLVPILTTAIATTAAFAPVLVVGNVPGLELLRPIAAVVVGGLVSSTLLNLFVLPALCLSLKVNPTNELELAPLPELMPAPLLGGAATMISVEGGQ